MLNVTEKQTRVSEKAEMFPQRGLRIQNEGS
jgi:hypothetical protein